MKLSMNHVYLSGFELVSWVMMCEHVNSHATTLDLLTYSDISCRSNVSNCVALRGRNKITPFTSEQVRLIVFVTEKMEYWYGIFVAININM